MNRGSHQVQRVTTELFTRHDRSREGILLLAAIAVALTAGLASPFVAQAQEAEHEARSKAEEQARAAAANATGVESYLEDVDDVIVLNTNGKKYNSVEFPHLAHSSMQYLPNGTCNDCHHTLEGDDEAPEACDSCHNIGGDADEDRAKTRATHSKKKGFPREAGQEETSCVGCHKSMNAALKAGTRQGEKAPSKCKSCHTKK